MYGNFKTHCLPLCNCIVPLMKWLICYIACRIVCLVGHTNQLILDCNECADFGCHQGSAGFR